MTCYDCIHCGACSDAGDSGFSCLKEDVSKCKHFKNKDDFVEVKCRCSECKHLKIINKEPVYAECERQKLTFLLWQADTREHTCSYGERRDT
jgi:hypothetical protein